MTVKQVFNLPIDAGLYTEETERGAAGRWHDADKVRFRKGLPEKIGGWIKIQPQFLGKCRRLLDWSSLDGKKWVALATELKLYIWQGSVLYDITPIRREVTLGSNPFATTSGSELVVVTDTSHGAQTSDFVRFTGATTVAGLTLNGEFQITEVLTSNTYRIDAGSNANATTTGGGAAVHASYDINSGPSSAVFGSGYSTGGYSESTYSTPRANSTTVIPLRTWALDTWGEDLVACPNGSAIYWWDRTGGPSQRAVELNTGGAPLINSYIIVSQRDRQLIALGAYDTVNGRRDPLLIRWCSQENFNDWIPTVDNTSGDLRLFSGSKFVTAIRMRGEVLIFTDESVHSLTLIGAGNYGINTLGESVSVISPNAVVATDYRLFFMAESDFYVYDGVLRVLPCDVRNFVYDGLTVSQKDKVYCGLNRDFNEVWWFYPAKNEDLWVEADFSISAETTLMRQQSLNSKSFWADDFWAPNFWAVDFWVVGSGGVVVLRYEVEFNSSGYIELTTSPPVSSPYDAIYMVDDPALILNPLESDYEVTFTLNGTPDMTTGIAFNVTDLSGTADTAADNIKALVVEVNPSTNRMYLRTRTASGTVATMAGAAAFYSLAALSIPVTLTNGRKYGISVKRSNNTIEAYLWDAHTDNTQFVAASVLSAGEIAAYTAAEAGVVLWGAGGAASPVSAIHVHSFRVASAGVLARLDLEDHGISSEISRYVIFNYEENTWSLGAMTRTAWHDRSPVLERPYATGTDGYIYKHETGTDDNGIPLLSYIESYMMEIPDAGGDLMHMDQLIPDFLTLEGSVDVFLKGRRYPHSTTLIEKGPFSVTNTTQVIAPRMRARQISIRIESSDLNDNWRAGRWRGRAGAHGKR